MRKFIMIYKISQLFISIANRFSSFTPFPPAVGCEEPMRSGARRSQIFNKIEDVFSDSIKKIDTYVCSLLYTKIRVDFLHLPRSLKGGRKSITPFRDWGKRLIFKHKILQYV